MDNLKPVRWQEGMFLRPHHLQRAELYHEAMRNGRLKALEPQGWGLVHLELSEDALENFNLSVKRLRIVLEAGGLVDARNECADVIV